MGIESLRQDTVALIRPQWQHPASLEEATDKFAEAVSQHYQVQETERTVEPEEMQVETTSEGEPDEDDGRLPELDERQSSSEDNEVCPSGTDSGAWSCSNADPRQPFRHLLPPRPPNWNPRKRRSSSLAKKRSGIQRPKRSSIVNWPD